jgi:hypothetical protein
VKQIWPLQFVEVALWPLPLPVVVVVVVAAVLLYVNWSQFYE